MDAGKKKLDAKDFDGAIALYTQAIKLDPKSFEAYKFRGVAKSTKGDWKGCLEDVNAALSISPANTEALALRGFSQINLGDAKAANEDFKELERLDPKDGPKAKLAVAQNLISKAREKSAKHDYKAAINDLNLVLVLYPDSGVAFNERGSANLELKQYKAAIEDLDNAIKYDAWHNQFGESYRLRAKARKALGDVDGAKADQKEADKRYKKGQ